jgi:aquaporin related protein
MMISGALPWVRGLLLFPAQILGGMVAAALVSCLFPGPLAVETTLAHGTSIAQGVFIEMFLTAELVITILMLAAEKTRATFIAPVGIGLALFVAELTGPPTHGTRNHNVQLTSLL